MLSQFTCSLLTTNAMYQLTKTTPGTVTDSILFSVWLSPTLFNCIDFQCIVAHCLSQLPTAAAGATWLIGLLLITCLPILYLKVVYFYSFDISHFIHLATRFRWNPWWWTRSKFWRRLHFIFAETLFLLNALTAHADFHSQLFFSLLSTNQ